MLFLLTTSPTKSVTFVYLGYWVTIFYYHNFSLNLIFTDYLSRMSEKNNSDLHMTWNVEFLAFTESEEFLFEKR